MSTATTEPSIADRLEAARKAVADKRAGIAALEREYAAAGTAARNAPDNDDLYLAHQAIMRKIERNKGELRTLDNSLKEAELLAEFDKAEQLEKAHQDVLARYLGLDSLREEMQKEFEANDAEVKAIDEQMATMIKRRAELIGNRPGIENRVGHILLQERELARQWPGLPAAVGASGRSFQA